MNILGVWDGHDAGAALLVNGRVVAAVNEERYSRRKLEVQFPIRSIRACLDISGVAASAIDIVAGSTTDIAKTIERWLPWTKEQYYAVRRRQARFGMMAAIKSRAKYRLTEFGSNAMTRILNRVAVTRAIRGAGVDRARIALFDHHECHAVAAAAVCGARRCLVLTIDGLGDGLSSTVSVFEDGRLRRVAASPARDSLGVFFEHVTHLLNMRELEDEGKVMALADFAAPVADGLNPLLALVRVEAGQIRTARPGHALREPLRRLHWTYPNEQFAFMAQRTVEHACEQLARDAVRMTGVNRVALAGGVASNIKASRRVRLLPEVSSVHVFPHMGDGGLAVGAAIAAAVRSGDAIRDTLSDLGLGPEFSDQALAQALSQAQLGTRRPDDLESRVADLLVDGKVVLWFQGRMEYGPRALGHRSMLARPDQLELRDRLNLVQKRRVWYQPFCPTMLEADAARVLADWDGPSNRHMTMAYLVAPDFRQALSGVTGVDGSCRPQVVAEDDSSRFGALLRGIRKRLGLGIVLNTSFNIHGEPLVCTPQEAVDVFDRSKADALAMGPFLVTRETNAH